MPWVGWEGWEVHNGLLFPPGYRRGGIPPGEFFALVFYRQQVSEYQRLNARLKAKLEALEAQHAPAAPAVDPALCSQLQALAVQVQTLGGELATLGGASGVSQLMADHVRVGSDSAGGEAVPPGLVSFSTSDTAPETLGLQADGPHQIVIDSHLGCLRRMRSSANLI
ncbi:MAG: hypothetical protein MZV65_49320 [Chromatiales bacterium]|nr:hypothetical protein [Chromatiales bacterium]